MSTDRVGGSGIVRRHKATHATGGTDALTPADIGAADSGHTHPSPLPTQTGNTNHVLATNGTTASWRAVEDDQFILSAQVFG